MDGLGVLLWAFFFKTCKIWSSKVKEDKTVRDNILYRVTDKNWATVSHLEACHIFQSNKPRSPWTTLCIFSKQVVFDLGISALSYNFPKKMVRKKKKTDDVIARHYCKDWRERFTFICGIFFFSGRDAHGRCPTCTSKEIPIFVCFCFVLKQKQLNQHLSE